MRVGEARAAELSFVDRATALEKINEILGMTLITHQTGSEGRLVKKVMVAEALDIAQEFCVAITLDRSSGKDVFMVSSEGGMEIEEVAKTSPEKIVREAVTPGLGLLGFQGRRLAKSLGLEGKQARQARECFRSSTRSTAKWMPPSWRLIFDRHGTGALVALDAKMNFDGNALYMHSDVVEMRDLDEEDPAEVEADTYNLNYIKLDGEVGCMVNGAGLAMATMDIIKQVGGSPANFLDVGGGANVETVKNGFRIIWPMKM